MRVARKQDIKVTIYPSLRGFMDFQKQTPADVERLEMQEAERLRASVRKHLEDYDSVSLTFDVVSVCSFCGYTFDKSEKATDEPACCDEAIAEFNAKEGK